MSKFVAVALIVGSLVLGAVPAMAQIQGGIADPNTLAASGVILPFFTSGVIGTVATIQAASPVGNNLDAHMFFFNASCARIPISVGIPLTTNDIAFQQVADVVPAGVDGLVTLAKSDASGFTLIPLDNPVHTRMYAFNTNDGRSRVLNPIIVNSAEFPSLAHWYSPLRSGATFFAPLQTATVTTDLLLICPTNTIVGGAGAAFGADTGGGELSFTTTGFPQINPRLFPTIPANEIRVRVYNVDEVFLRDFTISCQCTSAFPLIAQSINTVYSDARPGIALDGTYTELTSVPHGATLNPSPRVSFTGYTSTGTTGSAVNAFFAPIHSGSQLSIDGPAVVSER